MRTSLNTLDARDAQLLDNALREQQKSKKLFALDAHGEQQVEEHRVKREERDVVVTVPDNVDDTAVPAAQVRESLRIQAMLATIGMRMGFQVWIPANDRAAVLREAPSVERHLLTKLPLHWLRKNSTLL